MFLGENLNKNDFTSRINLEGVTISYFYVIGIFLAIS